MTSEGVLWEDIHHFVDYLACRDVALAHDLNELLLHRPKEILRQFETMFLLMQRPLCNHEVLGRGYVFSREPVWSPSDLVGRLVLHGEAEKLGKGLAYLTIMDADFVEHQQRTVHGMQLEKIRRSCFLLVDTFRMLHASVAWTEAHFVDALKEFSLFFPNAANSLHLLGSPFILVELLLRKKRTMLRFVDLRRMLPSPSRGALLLKEMGRTPQLLLHEEEPIFQRCIQWLPTLALAGYTWRDSLEICRALHFVWKLTAHSFDEFMDRAEKLHKATPRGFMNSLHACLGKTEEEWESGHLPAWLEKCDQVVKRRGEVHESHSEIFDAVPSLLVCEGSYLEVESNLKALREGMEGVDLCEAKRLIELLNLHPSIAQDPSPAIEMCGRVWPVICDAITERERLEIISSFDTSVLVEVIQKLDAVIQHLQEKQGLKQEHIHALFKEKIIRVRQWKRHADLPKELVPFLRSLPSAQLADIISLDAKGLGQLEESLFVLFGTSPSSIFTNLCSMPALLEKETLECAVAVAQCCKVRRSDLRNEHFRTVDQRFALLIKTLQLTRARPEMEEPQVLQYLELLSEEQLLTGDTSKVDPVQLAQFCILCVEHPGAWEQFEKLMAFVHHPLLAQVRPEEMQKMKSEAFHAILAAPEIFLLEFLWNRIVEHLEDTQWTFAGLDVETVLATEPAVFFYTVQEKWRKGFDRNARKLFEAPKPSRVIRRRGKSITDVQSL